MVCGSMAVHHAATERKIILVFSDVDSFVVLNMWAPSFIHTYIHIYVLHVSPPRGCQEPESYCISRSADMAYASSFQEMTPSQLHIHTHTHHHGDSHHSNQLLSRCKLWDMKTPICLPKYTVLLHLGQMLGPPEKDEKLAAEKVTLNWNDVI